jgi:hypothetical protein
MPRIPSRDVRRTIELFLCIPQHLDPDKPPDTLRILFLVFEFRTRLLRTDPVVILLAAAVRDVAVSFASPEMRNPDIIKAR